MFSDYRPFLLVAGVLSFAGAVLQLRFVKTWRAASIVAVAASMIVAVINGIEVGPWLVAAKQKSKPGAAVSQTIKLLAFNIEGDSSNNTWFAETREFIRRQSPDVAMFCECGHQWPGELRSLTNEMPYHVRVQAMDIEVFSRHPLTRTNIFHFGPRRGFVVVGVSLQTTELSFVATHTYSRHWIGDQGFVWRNETLEEGLGKQLAAFPRPIVVMGDLNVSPWSPNYKRMMQTSRLSDARRGHGLLVTQHGHGSITKWLWKPIDHCLHSPETRVANLRTGPDLNSDHLPVIAELIIEKK